MGTDMIHDVSKVDLHAHTRYSADGDSSWLKQLKFRECWTDPRQVYDLALRRGMDFVTITDHDTIDGALSIAHLDRFFIGEEITALFPEDKAKFHVVALGIDENRHREIQRIRTNIYELTQYLNTERITHFVAHPFFRMGPPVSVVHFEKLMLLFKVFEVRNGGKQIWPETLLEDVLSGITPETLWRLADKNSLTPLGDNPWKKSMVAGSDDHGGILIGHPHTETPRAESVESLLDYIRLGECRPSGPGGSPLSVAHGIFSVAFQNLKHAKKSTKPNGSGILWNAAGQLLNNADPNRSPSLPLLGLLAASKHGWLDPDNPFGRKRKTIVRSLLGRILSDKTLRHFLKRGLNFSPEENERLFRSLADWIHDVWKSQLKKKDASLTDILPSIAATLTVAGSYAAALKTEYRDRPLMREIRRLYRTPGNYQNTEEIAVFTDGSSREVVETLVVKWIQNGFSERKLRLHVFGLSDESVQMPNRYNFTPIGEFKIGAETAALPPALDVIHRLFNMDAESVFIRTFGPMGFLGLALGKLAGAETVCRFPAHLLNRDDGTAPDSMNAVILFALRQADRVVVMNETEAAQAESLGISVGKLLKTFQDLMQVDSSDEPALGDWTD